ncbi:MAG TPA: glycosyltransferase family 9 protein [Puia sp.]|nr:glycosyltransferase family 9 protein [Puia sp.]
MTENIHIKAKPWKEKRSPKRILAIRLHAIGDVVITLPYLQHLRNTLPKNTRLDLLTIEECASIPQNINLFDNVYVIRGGRNFKKQLAFTFLLLPKLLMNRYDIVLDLNDAIISRLVRKALLPKAWATFDKFSLIPAGERTQMTIEAVGLGKIIACTKFDLKNDLNIENILQSNGWKNNNQLIILNPAGAFETRNWPLENYVGFAKLWLQSFPQTQFLILGVNSVQKKAEYFKNELGDDLIDLVNKTTTAEAFAIIQQVKTVLTEDSGLMHMSWVSGIPTLALFGSTRGYHAKPLGKKSFLFDSSDLPCGNCMLEVCKYGDTHCLTRYTPEMVFEKAREMV